MFFVKTGFVSLPAHRLFGIASGFQRYGSGFLFANIIEMGLITLGSLKAPEQELNRCKKLMNEIENYPEVEYFLRA
jgi:hypothetical protein